MEITFNALLAFLVCSVTSQRLASSTVTISGSNEQYDIKSAYLSDGVLLGSAAMIDVKSLDFSFSFKSSFVDVDTTANLCTIRTVASMINWNFNSITLRFVIISMTMSLRTMDVNVTGSSILPISSAPSWS